MPLLLLPLLCACENGAQLTAFIYLTYWELVSCATACCLRTPAMADSPHSICSLSTPCRYSNSMCMSFSDVPTCRPQPRPLQQHAIFAAPVQPIVLLVTSAQRAPPLHALFVRRCCRRSPELGCCCPAAPCSRQSWDVMEPIGYMLSLTYSLLAYFYFLVTRGNYFDYGPFEEYWTQQQLVRRMGADAPRRAPMRHARRFSAASNCPVTFAGLSSSNVT
eukprot:GHRQ01015068.1.p1 GENE.GHRQ01015068.1~~GHRQ01015068.1.p1  ORF type:complete len:219 (+),score=43.27 GHRQ01015068.1:456-1112(+)